MRIRVDAAHATTFRYRKSSRGYIVVLIRGRGWVGEHRIVAERAIGRRLKHHEQVHHINGIKRDNRPANLLICTKDYHEWLHRRCLAKNGSWHLQLEDAVPAGLKKKHYGKRRKKKSRRKKR